jgi:hypothetical protein
MDRPAYADEVSRAQRELGHGTAVGDGVSWSSWCHVFRVYDFWHEDLLRGLSEHLVRRYPSASEGDIIEVGAGDGSLAHWLRMRGIPALGSDDGSWGLVPRFPVIRQTFAEALRAHPKVVICSWMPYGKDWTGAFMACRSVDEYILIGESHGGCCGSDKTWGERFNPESREYDTIEGSWKAAGWLWEDLNLPNMCRTDYDNEWYHSHTHSFTRPALSAGN